MLQLFICLSTGERLQQQTTYAPVDLFWEYSPRALHNPKLQMPRVRSARLQTSKPQSSENLSHHRLIESAEAYRQDSDRYKAKTIWCFTQAQLMGCLGLSLRLEAFLSVGIHMTTCRLQQLCCIVVNGHGKTRPFHAAPADSKHSCIVQPL